MDKLTEALLQMQHLEALTQRDSWLHRLSPMAKIVAAVVMIATVLTVPITHFTELLALLMLWVWIMETAHLPVQSLFKRALPALCFALFLGLSNVFLMREPMPFYGFYVTNGFVSCLTLLMKTLLSVTAVFLLIATTGFDRIVQALIYFRIPETFVLQLMMTYRYLFLLIEEVREVTRAYLLRAPVAKGIAMKDMGSLVGSMLLRNMQRAKSVYHAMILRGFPSEQCHNSNQIWHSEDIFWLMILIGLLLLIKAVV